MKVRELSEPSVKKIDETIEKQKLGVKTLFQKIEEHLSTDKAQRAFSENCEVFEWFTLLTDLNYISNLLQNLSNEYEHELRQNLDEVLEDYVRAENKSS